ncbi:ArnT family glycosyltransferase [Actinocrinis sp.]|uniref:ArnT family glycosyltransferase n=1 Tax=Actinocrinis sp. TaxID=1920516 RepID=UPI002D5E1CC7|nr:glycosyltransferase family 39 protein [Actinocrinis sp.]HZP50604.1 glycosyltransferase family 39 protein [Actinocrinis sp.]
MNWRGAAFSAGLGAREIRELDLPRPSLAPPIATAPEGGHEHPDGSSPRPSGPGPEHAQPRPRHRLGARRLGLRALPLCLVLAVAALLRFDALAAVGLNSDEAVYTGSSEALAGNHALTGMFPIFRAHPILVQLLVGEALRISDTDWAARAVAAGFGVAAVALTYLLGARLYGAAAGLAAAAILAVMPYHVMVSRQVLLDGPMTTFAVVGLYCVVRAAESDPRRWIAAAGAMLGMAALAKETAVVLLVGVYAFGAMGAAGRLRLRHHALGLGVFVVVFATYPIALRLASASGTGQNFLLWQLLRRANHPLWFYFTDLPRVIGPAVLLIAAAGLVWLWPQRSWRERLLVTWVAVPLAFFTIWPVKGFQYLLPATPALAVLAGRPIGALWTKALKARGGLRSRTGLAFTSGAVVCGIAATVSLAVPTWQRITPSGSTAFLAGTGGLPGGRATGQWIGANTPIGARLLAAGPSIANVLEFYGHHQVGALSVSTDPRNRNPVYQPVANPDRAVRSGEYQYLVWDSFTAGRSPYYAGEIKKLIDKYHGVAVYTATVPVSGKSGPGAAPVIIVYEVHP